MVKRNWEIKTVVPKELFGKEIEIGSFSVWHGKLIKQEGTFIFLEKASIFETKHWEDETPIEQAVGNIWIELNTIEYIMVIE